MHQSDHDIRNRLLIARLPAMPQIPIKLIERLQAGDLGLHGLVRKINGVIGCRSARAGAASALPPRGMRQCL